MIFIKEKFLLTDNCRSMTEDEGWEGRKINQFRFIFSQNLHKNVDVTDRRVKLLGCMYDDCGDGGVVVFVVVAVARSEQEMHEEGPLLSLFLSFSHFSL